MEQSYEAELHGATGFERGRDQRRRPRGAAPGAATRRRRATRCVLSIDIRLQALVEEMFGDRRGALVAIDPRNGEVLAFVSKPTFDPNLFVDGIDADSWRELNESIDKPLLNRALRGTYPPGSTFKPFMAMAALNTGKRSAAARSIHDPGYFKFGNHALPQPRRRRRPRHGGHVHARSSSRATSTTTRWPTSMGVDLMHEQLSPFGFGAETGIDIDGEVTGLLPSTEWKRRAYKQPEQQKWYAGETISLGIGQGYNNFTMLQLARPRPRWPPAASASSRGWCARSRTWSTRERSARRQRRAGAAAAQARARRR